jgi:hypothetical protein
VPEKLVDQIRSGAFAVGAGDTDDRELPRGMSVKAGGDCTEGEAALLDLNMDDVLRRVLRKFLAHHGNAAGFHGGGDVVVSIDMDARRGDEHRPRHNLARVVTDGGDLRITRSGPGYDGEFINQPGKRRFCHAAHGSNSGGQAQALCPRARSFAAPQKMGSSPKETAPELDTNGSLRCY